MWKSEITSFQSVAIAWFALILYQIISILSNLYAFLSVRQSVSRSVGHSASPSVSQSLSRLSVIYCVSQSDSKSIS